VKRTFNLPQERNQALVAIRGAPDDCAVKILPPSKSRDQEERYHAMIGDIAEQCQHLNRVFDAATWKRLLIDQFKRETLQEPEECAEYWRRHQLTIIPSLDGSAVIMLGEQSRHFPKKVATVFIEWLFAYGGQREVKWTDPTEPPIEAYAEREFA